MRVLAAGWVGYEPPAPPTELTDTSAHALIAAMANGVPHVPLVTDAWDTYLDAHSTKH